MSKRPNKYGVTEEEMTATPAEETEATEATAAEEEAVQEAAEAPVEAHVEPVHTEAKPFCFPKPCVYCGPSVRGVARQYTVYAGEIPAPLREFVEQHPAARGLVVSVSNFASTRSNLGKNGTAEAILYEKIKSEL